MASLVQALAAGIPAAASGSAEFFQLGTATLSNLVYSDSAGTTAETTTALDQYGFVERYVDEPVTVRVYDSSGAFLRQFDHIEDARVVRLESPAFTGPNTTGAIVAGGQTTEQAAWSLFLQSFGATDAYVGISGGSVLLKTVLAASETGVFFNVVAFGADPTGVADSTAYIQAAINAAALAGGGIVYFPPGTFRTTAALSLATGTYLLGVSGLSLIQQSTTGINGWLTLAGGTYNIAGLGFSASTVTFTGRAIQAGSSAIVNVIGCDFSAFAGTAIYSASTTCDIRVTNCTFDSTVAAGSTAPYLGANAGGLVKFTACSFTCSGPASGYILFSGSMYLQVDSCQIVHSATGAGYVYDGALVTMTGGMIRATSLAASAVLKVVKSGTAAAASNLTGVQFYCNATGFIHLMDTGSSISLTDSGCYLDPTNDNIFFGTAGAAAGVPPPQSREALKKSSSAVTTSYTPDAAKYGIHIYTQTGGAAFTLNNPSANCGPFGRLIVIWSNASGSNITPAFGTGYAAPTAVIVNTGSAALWEFIKGDGTTTTKYVAAGPQTVFTP